MVLIMIRQYSTGGKVLARNAAHTLGSADWICAAY